MPTCRHGVTYNINSYGSGVTCGECDREHERNRIREEKEREIWRAQTCGKGKHNWGGFGTCIDCGVAKDSASGSGCMLVISLFFLATIAMAAGWLI